MELIAVDAGLAEKARLQAERARARRERYESKTGRRNHHGKPEDHNKARLTFAEYPFIMWDGEAPQDTGYSLFGSSEGHEVCRPHLTTEDCFDLLIEAKQEHPKSIFIIFGGRYDWDEICRQSMPLDRQARLENFGHVTWHGYTIRKMSGKIFSIRKDGITVRIFEIFGWFHKRYVEALKDYGIGTSEEIRLLESEKNRRAEFLWSEITEIRKYMRLELKLGPLLMEKIREIVLAAGFRPRAWYGPSALAAELLSRHKIKRYMATCPPSVNEAAQHAYCAGRFEMFRGGIMGPTYTWDMNSAYMGAALELPDLAHGTWRKGRGYEPGKFALYRIKYRASSKDDFHQPYPLFRRLGNGNVTWHRRVVNWYWAPEAELVKDDPDAVFLESLVFDEDDSSVRPFEFVRDIYAKRMVLEGLPKSNPSRKAGKAFKWALASIYGHLARRIGWDRFRKRAPKYHQLEWAGFITSWCKAAMYKLAKRCGKHLISIDTDSVTASCPLDVDLGTSLGQWKLTEADYGVFFQSGVYFLFKDGEWVEGKMRGMEQRKGKPLVSPEMLMGAIKENKSITLRPKRRYVSVRMALNGQFEHQGEWTDHPADKLMFGGGGKRSHAKCRPGACSGDVHQFFLPPSFSLDKTSDDMLDVLRDDPVSYPHPLPWKGQTDYLDKDLTEDILWFDPERIDDDDEWLVSIA
jgi:hypothetical protein